MSSPPAHSSSPPPADSSDKKSKSWFHKLRSGSHSSGSGVPISKFQPQSLDKEAEQAAYILRSFFIDGFIVPHQLSSKATQDITMQFQNGFRSQMLKRVNAQALKDCKAVVIFHALRKGLHETPTGGGSGVVVARLPNGKWSPPSAVLVKTTGLDLVKDADVYDCLCVINNELHQITRPECTLGVDLPVHPGPVGDSPRANNLISQRQSYENTVWTYVKGRGEQAADADLSGIILFERIDENERCYSIEGVNSRQILGGEVKPSMSFDMLWDALMAFDGSGEHGRIPPAAKTPGEHRIRET